MMLRKPSLTPPPAAGNLHGGGLLAVVLVLILFLLWLWSAFSAAPELSSEPSASSPESATKTLPRKPLPAQPSTQKRSIRAQLAIPAVEQVSDGAGGFHVYLGRGGWDEDQWQRFWTEQPDDDETGLSPEETAQRLLELAEIGHWQVLNDEQLTQQGETLLIEAQTPDASVYELFVLQHDATASARRPNWLWHQRLSAPPGPEREVLFTQLKPQPLAYLRLQAGPDFNPHLNIRLQLDVGDQSWQWLRQRLASGLHPEQAASDYLTLDEPNTAPTAEPWWQSVPLQQVHERWWGPLAAQQTLTWSLGANGINEFELIHWTDAQEIDTSGDLSVQQQGQYELAPGENILNLNLSAWQAFFASRIDLLVSLRDPLTQAGVAAYRISREMGDVALCQASDEAGRCLLQNVATERRSEFLVEATTSDEEGDESQVLPRYPSRFSQYFDPLDHAQALASDVEQLELSWSVPLLHWLHLDAASLLAFSGEISGEEDSAPIFFLQQLLDVPAVDAVDGSEAPAQVQMWQNVHAEYFIQRDDGLWVSALMPGEYRLVVARNALDIQLSDSVMLDASQPRAELKIEPVQPARLQLAHVLEQLPDADPQQVFAVYCEDFPIMPRFISRTELLHQGLEVSGCQQVVWEWETPSGESETLVTSWAEY